MAARYLSKGRQIVVEGRIWPDLRLTAGQTAGRPPDKPAADRRQTEK